MPQKSQHSCFQNHFPMWQHHTGKLLPKEKRKSKLLVIISHDPDLSPHKLHAHTSVKRKNTRIMRINEWVTWIDTVEFSWAFCWLSKMQAWL
jgi:hypothetical protein